MIKKKKSKIFKKKKTIGYKSKFKKTKPKRSYKSKDTKYKEITDTYPLLNNPQKYCGKTTHIHLRSSYEITYAFKLDKSENVLKWSSEDIVIRYLAPDGKWRRYYTDFYIKHSNGKEYIIEVKPAYQAKKLNEAEYMKLSEYGRHTYNVNRSKWKATQDYCADERKNGRKIYFRLVTEKELLMEEII